MKLKFFATCVYVIVAYLDFLESKNIAQHDESLIMVHVLFRHGNRTPNGPEELYPKDPYLNETYFPIGLGELTKAGKMKEYYIGKFLRKRYNDFLGPIHDPEIVESWSTDYNRTKMSLELVLASLFPPYVEEISNKSFNRPPMPFDYFSRSSDKVLLGTLCPNYLKLYNKNVKSLKWEKKVNNYSHTFQYISNHTGLDVTKFQDIMNLYFGLATEEEWGFKLPSWTKQVWPQAITDLATEEYFVATDTSDLRRMATGYFIQKIISDSKAKISKNDNKKKIYLYSAHENNIAELLSVLHIFDPPHIPNYGSFLIFEIHKIKNTYGIKIYYENYIPKEIQLLKLPSCEILCDLDKFISIVEELLPSADLCGNVDSPYQEQTRWNLTSILASVASNSTE